MVFSKSGCAHSLECKGLFDAIAQPYVAFELDQRSDGEAIEAALLSLTQVQLPSSRPSPSPSPSPNRTLSPSPRPDQSSHSTLHAPCIRRSLTLYSLTLPSLTALTNHHRSQGRPMPNVFVRGQLLGGSAELQEAAATSLLYELLEESVLPPKGCVVPTRGMGPK